MIFPSSGIYWEYNYQTGGNSGPGSYGRLSLFKSEIINKFVKENMIKTVTEFGCGDGNQLLTSIYPFYTGLDVSKSAIKLCKNKFINDKNKSFFIYDPESFIDNRRIFSADLTLSIDVMYHVIEEEIYSRYMDNLFNSSNLYVIIYSLDRNIPQTAEHVKYRRFTDWIKDNKPQWKLIKTIKNRFPYDPDDPINTSQSDFYFYKKV